MTQRITSGLFIRHIQSCYAFIAAQFVNTLFINVNRRLLLLIMLMGGFISQSMAVVMYDEGRETIDGVQLLRDKDKPKEYYYLPQYPRLANKEDGSLEFLCMKYVGGAGEETNGGIFHALVEFSLPAEVIEELQAKLQAKVPGAEIKGMVPLMQAVNDDESGLASFEVVSAILNDQAGDNPLTNTLVTSGFAPLLPGSKAAIAAKLNQAGATLLWESLGGPTSDVSVSIKGYYEAAVEGYNAVVSAEVENIYEHYSRISSNQSGYTKRQLRKVTDELVQNQVINIDVFDRSGGLGIDTKNMESILNLITEKLIDLIFDAEKGWSREPAREIAVEANQIKGRQERGWFSKTFLGAQDTPYFTDDQFVLKKRKDVRVNTFYLNLSKSTTIKVPIYTSGNIGGLYRDRKEDPRYFRLVNLDDTDFQTREVHFQVDGQFTNAFNDLINFVTVSFKKDHGDETTTRDLTFRAKDLEEQFFKSLTYPRLGASGDDWLNFDYKVSWSIKGIEEPINFPGGTDWISSSETSVPLRPPLSKRVLEVDADRTFFKEAKVVSCSIRFLSILGGKASVQKTLVLRASDTENTSKLSLYHDSDEPLAYQVTWYTTKGNKQEDPKILEGEYLFLIPPSSDE